VFRSARILASWLESMTPFSTSSIPTGVVEPSSLATTFSTLARSVKPRSMATSPTRRLGSPTPEGGTSPGRSGEAAGVIAFAVISAYIGRLGQEMKPRV
jgi:hypothetical protein